MKKYRKRPLVIEAAQWDGETIGGLSPNDFFKNTDTFWAMSHGNDLCITTLEGDAICEPGNWIIKGIKNEFYPCRHDIFEETYEEVIEPNIKDIRSKDQ